MKRLVILLAFFGAVYIMTPSIAQAEHLGTLDVSATVTPSIVSASLTINFIDYGTVHLSTTLNEPTGVNCDSGFPSAFFVSNTGTENQDFSITGGSSANWTLAGTAGAATGTDNFFCASPDTGIRIRRRKSRT